MLSHAYAFKAGFFFVDGFGGQCEELMTNLLRHLAENRAPGPLPGHVLIIRKGNNADLNAVSLVRTAREGPRMGCGSKKTLENSQGLQ